MTTSTDVQQTVYKMPEEMKQKQWHLKCSSLLTQHYNTTLWKFFPSKNSIPNDSVFKAQPMPWLCRLMLSTTISATAQMVAMSRAPMHAPGRAKRSSTVGGQGWMFIFTISTNEENWPLKARKGLLKEKETGSPTGIQDTLRFKLTYAQPNWLALRCQCQEWCSSYLHLACEWWGMRLLRWKRWMGSWAESSMVEEQWD